MKKEVKEQELLLNGYQLENERLFKEVKRRDIERKELQSTLVEENQRLSEYCSGFATLSISTNFKHENVIRSE